MAGQNKTLIDKAVILQINKTGKVPLTILVRGHCLQAIDMGEDKLRGRNPSRRLLVDKRANGLLLLADSCTNLTGGAELIDVSLSYPGSSDLVLPPLQLPG